MLLRISVLLYAVFCNYCAWLLIYIIHSERLSTADALDSYCFSVQSATFIITLHSAASCVKNSIWGVGSCNLSTDSNKFSTEEIMGGCQQFQFYPPHILPKWEMFLPQFCILGKNFSDKKNIFDRRNKLRWRWLLSPVKNATDHVTFTRVQGRI